MLPRCCAFRLNAASRLRDLCFCVEYQEIALAADHPRIVETRSEIVERPGVEEIDMYATAGGHEN